MPKVLRILNRFVVGGPALHVVNLTNFMAPEFDTLLVVGNKDDHEKGAELWAEEYGIEPVYISEMSRNIHPWNDYRSYQKLKKIIQEFKPDIVHTHGAKSGAIGRLAAHSMNVPVIIHTYHGHIFHSYFGFSKTRFYLGVERFLAKRSDMLIAISKLQKKELEVQFKISDEKKISIIPLGFDLNKFKDRYAIKRTHFRQEFNLNDNTIAIGIISRLAPIKNHQLFIEAVAYITQNSRKDIKAFIVGDGEMKKVLIETAQKLKISYTTENLSDYTPFTLIFTSWRNDIDFVNAGLDIITLTSFNEGTPVSLIEAQAANKPIVSTKVGGIEDIVVENESALLSNINDDLLFKKNLLRVVEDDELRLRMGKNRYDRIKELFDYSRLVKDMTGLYNILLKKKKGDVR